MLIKNLSTISATYKDAITSLDTAYWLQAISAKIQSAIAVEAQGLTEKPKGRHIIDVKQIYSIKMDINGNFIKRKARQIAQRF